MRHEQYLIVRSDQPENVCGPFTGQILIAEGFMGFTQVDLATEPLPDVRPGDLVLLTRCFLRNAELDAVLDAVHQGAGLVALQPQRELAERLGWTSACRVVCPGRVRIVEGYPGAGPALQTHLPVACFAQARANGWDTVARAVDPDGAAINDTAAAVGKHGKGRVALFFYDVPGAVARIRFGNPNLGGYATGGEWDWPHTMDLFIGHVDHALAHVPQADLHAQLLAKMLTETSPFPLARVWYYAKAAHRTAGVFESDGDWSTPEQFYALADALERRNGTATFYLMADTHLSESNVAALRARGHTFGPHIDPLSREETLYFAMTDALAEETAAFKERFGTCSATLQCHCAPWPGYLSMAPAHVANGYRMLFAYLSFPTPLWSKYMCGSGRPMKFCDGNGAVHDCWQQPIITPDDESLIPKLQGHPAEAKEEFDATIRDALERHHSAIGVLSHPVSFCTYSRPVMEHVFDRLRESGAPIYNGDEWLAFTDRRASVRVEQEDARCRVSNLAGEITLMLPLKGQGTVAVNGDAVPYQVERRLEEDYGFVHLDAGRHGENVCVDWGLAGAEM